MIKSTLFISALKWYNCYMIGQLIFFGLSFLVTYTASFYKKSKKIFFFCFALYIMILACFSYTNNDTEIYMNERNMNFGKIRTKDIGFGVYMFLCQKIGFSFRQFRLISYLLGFLFLFYSVYKVSKENSFIALLVYFLYPFIYDNIETRNFLAYSIFTLALVILNYSQNHKYIKFFILVLVGSIFHKIILIYAIPIVLYFLMRKTNYKKYLIYYDLFFVLLCVIGINKNFITNILNTLPDFIKIIPGIDRNLSSTNNFGWIVNLATTISFYIFSRVTFSLTFNNFKEYSKSYCDFAEITFFLSYFGCCLVPFYILSGDFLRVIRNLVLINAAVFSYLFIFNKINFKANRMLVSTMAIVSLLCIEILNIYYANLEVILIYDTFVNCYFFNGFKLKYEFYERYLYWNLKIQGV